MVADAIPMRCTQGGTGLGRDQDTDLFLPSDELGGSEDGIVGILLVVPREPRFNEGEGDVRPIDFDSSNEASVRVALFAFDTDLLAEYEVRGEPLGALGEVRAALWAVDPLKADPGLL